jgi:hypothetical protein
MDLEEGSHGLFKDTIVTFYLPLHGQNIATLKKINRQ